MYIQEQNTRAGKLQYTICIHSLAYFYICVWSGSLVLYRSLMCTNKCDFNQENDMNICINQKEGGYSTVRTRTLEQCLYAYIILYICILSIRLIHELCMFERYCVPYNSTCTSISTCRNSRSNQLPLHRSEQLILLCFFYTHHQFWSH